MHRSTSRRFAIAVSFPGEHRQFVRNVVRRLAEALGRERVFFDEWYQPELIGLDGDLKLRRYYREESDVVVPFFSEHYRRPWCEIEWHAIRAMLLERRVEDAVVPVELDGTRIDGWESVDFAIRRRQKPGHQVANLILAAYSHRYPEPASDAIGNQSRESSSGDWQGITPTGLTNNVVEIDSPETRNATSRHHVVMPEGPATDHNRHTVSLPVEKDYLDQPSSVISASNSVMAEFRSLLRPERKSDLDAENQISEFLNSAGVLSDGYLTRTGVLLFTDRPETIVEGAYIRATKLAGVSVTDVERSQEIDGPVFLQITGAISFLESLVNTSEVFLESAGRSQTEYEYPMVCVREIVANAVCHRDYRVLDRHTHVRLFRDRIEVLNPGDWYGVHSSIEVGTPLERLRSESKIRNKKLARLLSWLKYVESLGSGIRRAIEDCEEAGAPLPVAEERDGYVVVTIYPRRRWGSDKADKSRRTEVVRKGKASPNLEAERLSLLQSRQTEHQRLEVLQSTWKNNSRSAFSIMGKATNLKMDTVAAFLHSCPGWSGTDLENLVRTWMRGEVGVDKIRDWFLNFLSKSESLSELAYLCYAGIQQNIFDDPEELFVAYGLPEIDSSLDIEFVRVPPPGAETQFLMGGADEGADDSELPVHHVELAPFRIAITPVTNEQYRRFSSAPQWGSQSSAPMVDVSWWEAWLFCKWVGGNLPTEAQWEFACRAGTRTKWWCGDTEKLLRNAAYFDEGADGEPQPVRCKEPNSFGLYDVHGNVWEWCWDWYAPYSSDEQRDPIGPSSGGKRVLRGGNSAVPAYMCRSAFRYAAKPETRNIITGFRIVLPEFL